jgi:hypothetical protein
MTALGTVDEVRWALRYVGFRCLGAPSNKLYFARGAHYA